MPRVEVAEQPGLGFDGRRRPSEDVVVVLPHAVLLLDGATSLRANQRSGGWYARRLADRLAAGFYDADAWQAVLVSPNEEHALGLRLVELGKALQARAARRRTLIVDSGAAQRPVIEPGAEPDNGP